MVRAHGQLLGAEMACSWSRSLLPGRQAFHAQYEMAKSKRRRIAAEPVIILANATSRLTALGASRQNLRSSRSAAAISPGGASSGARGEADKQKPLAIEMLLYGGSGKRAISSGSLHATPRPLQQRARTRSSCRSSSAVRGLGQRRLRSVAEISAGAVVTASNFFHGIYDSRARARIVVFGVCLRWFGGIVRQLRDRGWPTPSIPCGALRRLCGSTGPAARRNPTHRRTRCRCSGDGNTFCRKTSFRISSAAA